MGVTIFDVAAESGVSKATVSRAFTNPGAVSPETLTRIREAAKKLNYRPNAVARAMITKRTGNLAFIIYGEQAPVITNPFYGPILEAVVGAARDSGYSMFIASDDSLRSNSGDILLQKQVDGILFSSQPNRELVQHALQSDIPVVIVNNLLELEGCCCILCDDQDGVRQAMDHFVSLGHKRIALLGGRFTSFVYTRRSDAYQRFMREHGLPVLPGYTDVVPPTVEQALCAMERMLCLPQPPTAVLCMNDTLAIGALKAVQRAGLRVPQDISIIGFDNSALCTIAEPELSSLDQSTEEMGRVAVECLRAQIRGEAWERQHITLSTRLVLRHSTGPAPD